MTVQQLKRKIQSNSICREEGILEAKWCSWYSGTDFSMPPSVLVGWGELLLIGDNLQPVSVKLRILATGPEYLFKKHHSINGEGGILLLHAYGR